MTTDDFMALTLDVWEIPPESARRVGHPAPFPVELPEQLIRLYTFADDLVLDPFMGSGSSLVAAARLDRRYVGYDLDPEYVELARRRVADALADGPAGDDAPPPEIRSASAVAAAALTSAGFEILASRRKVTGTGLAVDLVVRGRDGTTWFVDVPGGLTSHRGGMLANDVVWRALGRAAALRGREPSTPLLLLTTALPKRGSDGDAALRAAGPGLVFDVIELGSPAAHQRLADAADRGAIDGPGSGFWSPTDLAAAR